MLTKEELPACPVATTVQMIGSKWKLLIIRNLMSRPWRFNELKKDLEGISQKVLTDSLRSMEADGIVTRTGWSTPCPSWANPCAPSSSPWSAGARSTKRCSNSFCCKPFNKAKEDAMFLAIVNAPCRV